MTFLDENPDLAEFLNDPEAWTSSDGTDWTKTVDDSIESIDSTTENGDIDIDSLQESLKLVTDANFSTWPSHIRSRVLMDIWHAMAQIKISKEHGFRRPFAIALRDAILIPTEEDKRRISAYLISQKTSWEERLQFNARWLWRRCRRVIPPPEKLYPAVQEVYQTYGPLTDAKTKKPLFNTQAWKDAKNVLKAIQFGLLSDPPGVPLYFQIGLDSKNGNLPIYRCARGTNTTEGGIHHSIRECMPKSGVSPHHAAARLSDYVYIHNLVVGTFNRTGTMYRGHYDIVLTNRLQALSEACKYLVPHSAVMQGWINGDLYIAANERIGILPVPDSIRTAAEIHSYIETADKEIKHKYLAKQQGSKYAVISVHTTAEKLYFKKLMQEHEHFNRGDGPIDWKRGAQIWNNQANGKDVFYKVSSVGIFCFEKH